MTHGTVQDHERTDVPRPQSDDENPALIDAQKTFMITVISVALFCLAALAIILATRMG